MNDSIAALTALADSGDTSGKSWDELEGLWVDAMDQRFQECRPRIKVLAQLAEKAGINRIGTLSDVVPLLFAHTAYKSYPEAFIEKNRWDRMNLWLSTLGKYPVDNVNVGGVQDADEWIVRLHEAGHYVFATSGTSGKNSFLDQSAKDVAFANKLFIPARMRNAPRRPVFVLGPRKAPNRASASFNHVVAECGRPDAVYFLTDAELRITDLSRMARMRRRIGEGTAMPSEISGFEREIQLRQAANQAMLDTITEAIVKHRDEPIILFGLTPQLWAVVEAARARGLQDGCFHPDTLVISGGGTKGVKLPLDHVEQIRKFLGIPLGNFTQGYGMQEISTGASQVEKGRYEWPNWVVPLLLSDDGEMLNENRTGIQEGRLALFDVSIDARWGGIISGDKVTVDYETSPGGRSGPAILDISRYSDLQGGDDKLTCAGTIDSFVRGAVDE